LQSESAPLNAFYVGGTHPVLVQIGQGLPSAKLETEVNSRIAPIARTRRAFFTVLLLDEDGITVVLCIRRYSAAHLPRLVLLFGKRKFVLVTSAFEDFEGRTLSAVPGLLGKLGYVAHLCNSSGAYSHWGLEKVHGSDAAGKAIRSSQRTLVTRILRTPLRDLADDLQTSATGAEMKDFEFLSALGRPVKGDLPVQNFRASEKHFMSVLHTLSALAQNRVPSNPQDVSPLLPPAR
jgi:hypothetical protein